MACDWNKEIKKRGGDGSGGGQETTQLLTLLKYVNFYLSLKM